VWCPQLPLPYTSTMLRFVQGIHKAFRSNQAYAPCQKAAHDPEEYEAKTVPEVPTSILQYGYNIAANTPLSNPLPYGVTQFETESKYFTPSPDVKQPDTNEEKKDKPNTGHSFPHGILSGLIVGAGYTAFNSLHGVCSGRKKKNNKYCPVSYIRSLQPSSAVLNGVTQLLPGYHRTALSVLPPTQGSRGCDKPSISNHTLGKPSITEGSLPLQHDGESVQTSSEYEKAKLEVNALADKLRNVDQEDLAADHFLAVQAWDNRDFGHAADLFSRTVDKFATPIAAYRLGECYEHGHGVPQNYQQAASYYEKAVSHDCAKAMYNLALLQMKGLVTEKSDSTKLIIKAAKLNHTKAQNFLGSLHFHKGNKDLAFKYFQKAAENNDSEGCYYLGICYETGSGVDISDDKQAAVYYMRAAELGHPDAQYNLAVFYEEGYGDLVIDQEKARYWLTQSSKNGNPSAKERLKEFADTEEWRMVSSSSLPIINRLQGVCSDLAEQTDMIRSYSDNCVTVTPHQNTTVTQDVSHVLSRTSSVSSVADGTPKFFIPSSVDEDQSWDSSTDTVDDWSDVCNPDLVDSIHNMLGSTTSLSSLYLARRDEEISVEFVVDKSSDEEDTTPPTLYKHTDKGSYNTLRLLAEQRRSSPVHFS